MDRSEDINFDKVKNFLNSYLAGIEKRDSFIEKEYALKNILGNYYNLLDEQPLDYLEQIRKIEENLEKKYGIEVSLQYNKVLVCKFILENYFNIDKHSFPAEVSTYLKEDFLRIFDFVKKDNRKYLTFKNYQFLSYVEELCFKRFPVGIQNIATSGFSRSLIFKQSFPKAISLVKLMLALGGNSPYFVLHLNPHRLRLFNFEGWNNVFHLVARMMITHPDIKGLLAGAWFYDPKVKQISPELNYIRELIENIGGEFFRVGSSEDDKADAFAFSRVRKVAYEEGRYVPTKYITIIPRLTLLKYYNLIS